MTNVGEEAPTAETFVVDTRRDGSIEVVRVTGRVDSTTVVLLEAVLDAVVARRPARVEVDLSAAVFADRGAIGLLAQMRHLMAARDADLVLRGTRRAERRHLES